MRRLLVVVASLVLLSAAVLPVQALHTVDRYVGLQGRVSV